MHPETLRAQGHVKVVRRAGGLTAWSWGSMASSGPGWAQPGTAREVAGWGGEL